MSILIDETTPVLNIAADVRTLVASTAQPA